MEGRPAKQPVSPIETFCALSCPPMWTAIFLAASRSRASFVRSYASTSAHIVYLRPHRFQFQPLMKSASAYVPR